MITMVPLGWAAQQHAWGPKRVLQLGNIGTAVSFLALPALASAGANFAVCCFFLLGLLQGPFVPAHNEMKRAWVAEGPGKPLALMVIGLGNRVGGALASTVTPILAARFGWRTVAYLYGGSVALFSGVWQCAVSNGPAELMAGAKQRERPAEPEAGGSEKTVEKAGASIFRVRTTARLTDNRPQPRCFCPHLFSVAVRCGAGRVRHALQRQLHGDHPAAVGSDL